MDFELYKIGRVIKDYYGGKSILTIENGDSEINFKVSDCFDDYVTLCTNFYYDNYPYNDVELKLKKYIDENYRYSNFIPYSELGDLAKDCLRELIGFYIFDFWVYKDVSCVELKFNIWFSHINSKNKKLDKLLCEKYESITLSDEYLEKIRKDYDSHLPQVEEERKMIWEKDEEKAKIKCLNYEKLNNILKFSSSKNILRKNYSIFLLKSFINDKDIVLKVNYDSSCYSFTIKVKYNQIYFCSLFRYGDSLDNPNYFESKLSKLDIDEYSSWLDISFIFYGFLDYSYSNYAGEVYEDKIELIISSSLTDIVYSDNILEKTLRNILLNTPISEEDYKKYDELWDEIQE